MATSDDDQLKYHFPTCNAPLSQLQSSTGIVYYGSCENPTDWSRMSTVIAKNRSASVNWKFTHVRLTTTDVKLGVEVVRKLILYRILNMRGTFNGHVHDILS